MGQLLLRNVDDDLIRRLKEQAAAHGRSVEPSTGRSSNGHYALVAAASSSGRLAGVD